MQAGSLMPVVVFEDHVLVVQLPALSDRSHAGRSVSTNTTLLAHGGVAAVLPAVFPVTVAPVPSSLMPLAALPQTVLAWPAAVPPIVLPVSPNT